MFSLLIDKLPLFAAIFTTSFSKIAQSWLTAVLLILSVGLQK